VNVRSISNKSFILNDLFTSHFLDFLFVTETWLKQGDLMPLAEIAPPDCAFFSSPWASGHGGGVATIFKNCFKCKSVTTDTFSSFQVQLLNVDLNCPMLCALIYRPPTCNKDFIQQFSDFLSDLVTRADRLLILGDFNIHLCCSSKMLVKEFITILESSKFVQSVCGPTHNLGHTD